MGDFVWIWIFILKLFVAPFGARECWEEFDCQYESISSTNDIECYGFSSCINSLLIETTSTGNIRCYGSFSCYNTSLIQHTGTSSVNIECMSLSTN